MNVLAEIAWANFLAFLIDTRQVTPATPRADVEAMKADFISGFDE